MRERGCDCEPREPQSEPQRGGHVSEPCEPQSEPQSEPQRGLEHVAALPALSATSCSHMGATVPLRIAIPFLPTRRPSASIREADMVSAVLSWNLLMC